MIQRIQSLYLALTTLLSLLFLQGSFLNFINKTNESFRLTLTGIFKYSSGNISESVGNAVPLTIVVVLIFLTSLLTIFLFKKRDLQLLLSKILIGLVLLLIIVAGYYSFSIISRFGATIIPGIKMALPVLMLILAALAFRGIKKDDVLVKSYDRLR